MALRGPVARALALALRQPARQPGGPASQYHQMLGLARAFHASLLQLTASEIHVGSFGESITEGTIGTVLKNVGDAVAEDEVIIQIETDKVTMDVRAPEAGTLQSVLVKPDDVVTVGQLLATYDRGEAAVAAPQPAAPAAEPREASGAGLPSQPEAPSGAGSAETAPKPPTRRAPSIAFPRRTTANGRRISGLPREEQERLAGQGRPDPLSDAPTAPTPPPRPAQPDRERPQAPWYVGRERGTKLSQSRVLSEKEMDLIELGGAEP